LLIPRRNILILCGCSWNIVVVIATARLMGPTALWHVQLHDILGIAHFKKSLGFWQKVEKYDLRFQSISPPNFHCSNCCIQLQLSFFIQQIHYVVVWILTFSNMIQEGDDDKIGNKSDNWWRFHVKMKVQSSNFKNTSHKLNNLVKKTSTSRRFLHPNFTTVHNKLTSWSKLKQL
jgi:hypothetical protein